MDKNATKDLRKEVADSILRSNDIPDDVLLSYSSKAREKYCADIRNTNEWGGEIEIRAIGKLYGVIVCVVKVVEVNSIISAVHVTEFPENESSFEKCVYIIYVHNHYEPLYIRDTNNSNEETTIFNRNDRTVKKRLCEFIRKKYNCKKKYEFEMKSKDIIVNLIIDHDSVKFNNKTNGDGLELESQPYSKYIT